MHVPSGTLRSLSFHGKVLGVVLLMLPWTACEPEPPVEPEPEPTTGTLRVRIVPSWQGAPFTMNAEYHNVNDYRVKVESIKFYLGDVRMVNGSGNTLVKDVEYFNLNNGTAERSWTVTPGTWSGIRFGLGVPADLNGTDPVDFPVGHPLDLSYGTYWSWAMGYRFLQFDGRYHLDGSSTGALTSVFSMHTGLNDCYTTRELAFPGTITVNAGGSTTLTLGLAVDRLFYSATDTVDLATENQTHGTNLPLALELTNNAVQSFTVE